MILNSHINQKYNVYHRNEKIFSALKEKNGEFIITNDIDNNKTLKELIESNDIDIKKIFEIIPDEDKNDVTKIRLKRPQDFED